MKQLVRKEGKLVLCKLLYILFCEKRNKIYGCVMRHRWLTNWYPNFFSSINSNAIRADCLSEEKRGRKSKNHLSGQ